MTLDYERTMNKISFDRIVASKPEMFSYVTLPDKEEEKVPEKGMEHSEAVGIQHGYGTSCL